MFITCGKSLEPLLAEELKELGLTNVETAFCGVNVPYSQEALFRINYLSRIAGRVLIPLATFPCRSPEGLYDAVKKIDWSLYLNAKKTFAIDVNGKHHAFRNTLFAAQVVKDAICDQLRDATGERPSVSTRDPDVQLNLFLQPGQMVLSFDASGEALFKRGYRRETGAAPLQESLAAALLRIAKYTGKEILIDPCCGSGTILIEAAMVASHTPAGFFRTRWGFFNLPDFSKEAWAQFRAAEDAKRIPLTAGRLFGFEVHRDTARIASVNVRFAGFQDAIQIYRQDFNSPHTLPCKPNLLVSNPPHGIRLSDEDDLRPLYRQLGDFCKHQLENHARAYIFTASLELSKEVGLKATKRHVLDSSGQECRLLEYTITN